MRADRPPTSVGGRLRRLRPAILVLLPLAIGLGLWFLADRDLLRPDGLLARRDALRAWVAADPAFAVASFGAVYFLLVSTGLPIGPPMAMLAGFLFGPWLGTATIVIAATGGALLVYGAARWLAETPLGTRLRARAEPAYGRIRQELRGNTFAYLVAMRLVPFFPFFGVNVAAGLLRVPVGPFALSTLVGRLPATFAYVSVGREALRASHPAEALTPSLLLALTGLGLLALTPIALRHLRGRAERR